MSLARTNFSLIVVGLVSTLPLVVLMGWAYAPAMPHAYPSVEELLLNTYHSAAAPMSITHLYLRQTLVLVYVFAVVLCLLRRTDTFFGAALAGVMASFILTIPAIVPAVLAGAGVLKAVVWLLALGACAVIVQGAAVRMPAVVAPLAVAFVLTGSYLSVRTSAEVVIRSNPSLFVLTNAARNPTLPSAQLALGMHLLAIGGGREVEPILREAGRGLVKRFRTSGDDDLLPIAMQVAAWSYMPISQDVIEKPSKSNE
ncbi:MAG: hypothetical protein ACI8RN_002170 [Glaciecola sp.]|uniref:hypothetical protein n=1 Tax=Congregibacter sp. TaxID=2744308 RepID=UPI0039E2E2C4